MAHRVLGPWPDKILQQLLVTLAPDQCWSDEKSDSKKSYQHIHKEQCLSWMTQSVLSQRLSDDILTTCVEAPMLLNSSI